MRVSVGPIKVLQYCLQALWHPARKVREPIWKVRKFELRFDLFIFFKFFHFSLKGPL